MSSILTTGKTHKELQGTVQGTTYLFTLTVMECTYTDAIQGKNAQAVRKMSNSTSRKAARYVNVYTC